jgi:hypothetical protein
MHAEHSREDAPAARDEHMHVHTFDVGDRASRASTAVAGFRPGGAALTGAGVADAFFITAYIADPAATN